MSNPHYPAPDRIAVNDQLADYFVEAANAHLCDHQDGNVESLAGWWARFTIADREDLAEVLDQDALADVIKNDSITLPAALLLRIDNDGNRELFSFEVEYVHQGMVRSYSLEAYEQDLLDEYMKWTIRDAGSPTLLCTQPLTEDPINSESCDETFTDLEKFYEHLVSEHMPHYTGSWTVQIGPATEMQLGSSEVND